MLPHARLCTRVNCTRAALHDITRAILRADAFTVRSSNGDNPTIFGFDDADGRIYHLRAWDHNLLRITNPVSDLNGDQYAVVLCDFLKLRFWKSPYEFVQLFKFVRDILYMY